MTIGSSCSGSMPRKSLLVNVIDGGGLRQGPITRPMLRHLEANKESEAHVQIKMLTFLTFEDSCKKL